MNDQLVSVDGAADAAWLTTTNLILIAVGVVLAIIVILYGSRLKRARRQVDRAIVDQADPTTNEPAPTPVADTRTAALDEAPPAPETAPVAHPPVAPAPPPLAGDDTPVVATAAPFDPAPATIAADLATPPSAPEADGADDLTRMKGVGPKLAAKLNDLGITRYAQIAALSPADAEALDRQLGSFQGRMTRDRWIEQAGYLANDDRAGFEAAFGKL